MTLMKALDRPPVQIGPAVVQRVSAHEAAPMAEQALPSQELIQAVFSMLMFGVDWIGSPTRLSGDEPWTSERSCKPPRSPFAA